MFLLTNRCSACDGRYAPTMLRIIHVSFHVVPDVLLFNICVVRTSAVDEH